MQQRSSEAREEFLRQTHHAQDDDVEMELQVSSHPTGAKQSLGNVLLYPPWCDTHAQHRDYLLCCRWRRPQQSKC